MTTDVLMKLGSYKFSVGTAAYESLSRSHQFNWQSQTRLGNNTALQFIGSQTTVTMDGVIYGGEGAGVGQIDAMIAEASKGEPLLLVAGTGAVLGYWAINKINEKQSNFMRDGMPRKQTFNLQLQYYGVKSAL